VTLAERKAARGRLKVFFGAAAGVGKTYAMLEEGRARAGDGLDVVVGYAEPHGRRETELLLLGMELLPCKTVEYKGATLRELDLDAVLKRRPQLALVDELAHTNAPDLRHAKRWQDVVELLDAGINVYTTLNVQHLESVNDIVERITGVRVRETLPDSVLEQADEVELIDTSPEELLERLQEGRIYAGEQAHRATKHFFTKGNLTALRELALRRTAERVDAQMQDLRRHQGTHDAWAATERILVCVGPSPLSARLVRSAKRLADGLKAAWIAAYVETPATMSQADRDRVAQTLRLAEQLGGQSVTLSGANPSDELIAYARARNVTKIVIGKPDRPRWKELLLRRSIVDDLIRRSGDIDVYAIRGEPTGPAVEQSNASAPPWNLWPFGWAALTVVVCTLIDLGMYRALGYGAQSDLSNLVMVFLLGVVLTAVRFGRGPAVLASLLSTAALDFLFVPPFYTFAVADTQYFITFGVMLAVAMIVTTLTDRVRGQAELSRRRESRTAALLDLSRELAATRDAEAIAKAATGQLAEVFDAEVMILVAAGDGALQVRVARVDTFSLDKKELSVAQWALTHDQIAGVGTATLPSARGLYLPLIASRGTVGVLAVRPSDKSRLQDPEQLRLLQAFANLIAATMDRANLADEARAAWERVEAEFLRNTLLSSVSHDLRTPLAAISGAAGTLLQANGSIDDATRRDLAETVLDESRRMERVISNLLDMTRLESGGLQLKRQWQPLAEVVGAALHEMDQRLAGRQVRVDLPADLPLVKIDDVSMEQVLVNLLDNAVEYASAGGAIEIVGRGGDGKVTLEIADHGPGIPPGTEQQIFQKFFRSHPQGGRRGIGLGLAICRGIVEAHGGTINATNRPGGGAVFRIELPVEGAPPPPVEKAEE